MMQPGRELDALIAEKVMGLPVARHQFDCGQMEYVRTDKTFPNFLVPAYSTSIVDAWAVVERLRDDQSSVFSMTYGSTVSAAFLLGTYEQANVRRGHAEATTATHAICLAALAAVGVDVSS